MEGGGGVVVVVVLCFLNQTLRRSNQRVLKFQEGRDSHVHKNDESVMENVTTKVIIVSGRRAGQYAPPTQKTLTKNPELNTPWDAVSVLLDCLL